MEDEDVTKPSDDEIQEVVGSIIKHVQLTHMAAGIAGGVISTLALHPLDLIKIRFAVTDGKVITKHYGGMTNAFFKILREEGFLGLYKGVTPNIIGAGTAWGVYFFFYATAKTWIQAGDATMPLGPLWHMIAAAGGGALTILVTNPIWVVKTRLCLQYDQTSSSKKPMYFGVFDALRKIYLKDGIRGWYKGLVPGLFGVSHGVVQFMTYDEMKNYYNSCRNLPINTKLDTCEYLTFAAISKFAAASSTYPYQVVRTRLQGHHHSYKGSWDCIKKIWKHENWRGFYKGLTPNLTRVVPATMITMTVYENMTHYFLDKK